MFKTKIEPYGTLPVCVADPGFGAFLIPGPGRGKKIRIRIPVCTESGSGMNNPDHISESLETVFGLKFGSGMEKIRARDKNPDPQHWYRYRYR
jgi:hypothetical protein